MAVVRFVIGVSNRRVEELEYDKLILQEQIILMKEQFMEVMVRVSRK